MRRSGVLGRVAVAMVVVGLGGLAPRPAGASANERLLTTYTVDPLNSLWGITKGPDSNIWFTEAYGNQIGRLTPAGRVTLYPLPASFAGNPFRITSGPDGAVWFAEQGRGQFPHGAIGRISTSGAMSEFTAGIGLPEGITTGPDGALWFADVLTDSIGRITTTGQVNEYPIPTAHSFPDTIVVGRDGNLWFTESASGNIGRITPQGTITEFYADFANNGGAVGLTRGLDGALWFTEPNTRTIGRITTKGAVTLFPLQLHSSNPYFIAAGADGNLYFAADGNAGSVGQMSMAGALTEIPVLDNNSDVTAGPDKDVWFTGTHTIGRIHTAGDTT